MRLLVTGPLGHIGSQYIRSLPLGLFDEVILLDNLSTQRFPSLFNLPEGIPYRFLQADVRTADLQTLCAGVDVVIHLAAITDAASSLQMREQVEEVNLEGTRRVAEACAANDCGMIFVSTTSVYGAQDEVVDESCPTDQLRPQSPYASSKLRAEQLLGELGQTKDLRFVVCRFGTIFGTSIGMRFHTAVNKFVWQACLGEPLTVWRTAMNQKRPYLALEDAVNAFHFILAKRLFDNRIYNVVTTNQTVKGIVDTIVRIVPNNVVINLVDSEIMNQLSYTVVSERFGDAGFEFRGSLERGIAETVRLFGWCPSLTSVSVAHAESSH